MTSFVIFAGLYYIMADFQQTSSRKTKTFYISTIISISLVLLMVGLLGLIILHARSLSNYVKENIVMSVIVNENANEVEVLQFQKELNANAIVKSTQYVSQELAAKNLSKDLGEDFVKFLGFNPLLSSIDIYLKAEYANNESIQQLEKGIKKNKFVKEVFYQESLVDLVNNNIRTISLIILGFGLVLLLIAIALINNTIRLAMYSQRFLIKSMQLVGATKNFIRKPFLITGIIHGLLGGLISIALLIATLYFVQKEIPELIILENYTEFAFLFVFVISIGVLISFISTYMAVTKYLNLKIYDLYS